MELRCHQIHHGAKGDLRILDPPDCASQVPQLQVCTTVPTDYINFLLPHTKFPQT